MRTIWEAFRVARALDGEPTFLDAERLVTGRRSSWRGTLSSLDGERSPSGASPVSRSAGEASGSATDATLSDKDLRTIETDYPDGLTSVQIVHIFSDRGIRFSEATLRKYVQLGLLPRSRRVGRKGKHLGSLGLYPAATVRRIMAIKRLMAENHTIEVIQTQFLRFRDEIEALERGLQVTFRGFEESMQAPHFDARAKRDLKRDVAEAKRTADDLVRRLEQLERRITEPHERPSGAGTPGGAEDLL